MDRGIEYRHGAAADRATERPVYRGKRGPFTRVARLTLPPGRGGLALLAHSFARPFTGEMLMAKQAFPRFCRERHNFVFFRR